MKLLINIIRYIVATVFIFSGFVKLVDPLGTVYKLEEYFDLYVLDMEYLMPYSLIIALFLIFSELMLGLLLAIGCQIRLTLTSILIITTLFLFLTGYSAIYDKVTDCGCFGDAIKLNAWETFYKNIGLMVFIILLIIKRNSLYSPFSNFIMRWIWRPFLLVFIKIAYTSLSHLPIIDFRPFAIGNYLPSKMEEKQGEDFAEIHDFYLENDNGDFTEQVLEQDKVMLLFSKNIEEIKVKYLEKMSAYIDNQQQKGYKTYWVTCSSESIVEQIKADHNINIEVFYVDQIAIKTAIRANPGVMKLEKGVVTYKKHFKDAVKQKD